MEGSVDWRRGGGLRFYPSPNSLESVWKNTDVNRRSHASQTTRTPRSVPYLEMIDGLNSASWKTRRNAVKEGVSFSDSVLWQLCHWIVISSNPRTFTPYEDAGLHGEVEFEKNAMLWWRAVRLGIGGLDSCMAGEWLGGLGGDERWHTPHSLHSPLHWIVACM